jgi:hypothetical protein
MKVKEWNDLQIKEALGDVNRYYFWQKYGRNGTDQELLLYYQQCGGADGFRKRNEKDRPKGKE